MVERKRIALSLETVRHGALHVVENKVEYESTRDLIMVKLNKIKEGIGAIRLKELKAAQEHLKLG